MLHKRKWFDEAAHGPDSYLGICLVRSLAAEHLADIYRNGDFPGYCIAPRPTRKPGRRADNRPLQHKCRHPEIQQLRRTVTGIGFSRAKIFQPV
jgi:hypothetical protein